ncbi:HNH endonuclease family protein [Janibacter sp. LM]|uniref:HNH endonuclease family protein n=1 Tax=Janibacter sp. LM TaxID=3144845 RepID=UPI0031F6B7CA
MEILWREHDGGVVDGERFADALEDLAESRTRHMLASGSDSVLDTGTAVPHYILNYLDYALWRGMTTRALTDKDLFGAGQTGSPRVPDVSTYRFRYRKSIEHFYPVQPSERHGQSTLPHDQVNRFGNLCLMTSSENSRRNNLVATAKAEEFGSGNEALKFELMAAITAADRAWGIPQITAHGAAMRAILQMPLRDLGRSTTGPPGLVEQ